MTTRVTPGRAVIAVATIVIAQLLIWYGGITLRDSPTISLAALSVILGILSAGLLGSLGEWSVHRYSMHTPRKNRILNVPYELHHVAHHWHHYTPDRFTHAGPIKYHPTHDPRLVCETNLSRYWVAVQQYTYYMFFGLFFVFLPAWLITRNVFFMAGLVSAIVWVCTMFVHVHGVTHHPGRRFIERFSWFNFLKRHHYIHHIDNGCNVNFLLPLCDVLFGTLRLSLRPKEIERWGTYEEALARVVPAGSVASGVALPSPDMPR
jgi:hypothetical protein